MISDTTGTLEWVGGQETERGKILGVHESGIILPREVEVLRPSI